MEQREKNWNKRYLEKDIPWEEESPSYVLEPLLKNYSNYNSKIFEIGCGLGTNALYIAGLGYCISAADVSEESIRLAKTRVKGGVNPNFFQFDFIKNGL
jgi:methyl halide transferase